MSISLLTWLCLQPKLGRIQETRTTLLRKSRPMPESSPLWKLPRFQQVKAQYSNTIAQLQGQQHSSLDSLTSIIVVVLLPYVRVCE